MKATLFTAALASIATGDHLELELVATFDGLANDGGAAESCHYDATDMVWRFTDMTMMGEMDSLPGSYPAATEFMQGLQGSYNGTGGELGIQYVNNAAVGPRLYIADGSTGDILIYDIATETYLDTTIPTGSPFTNGLCYDEDNDVLYATNVGSNFAGSYEPVDGLAAIYKISDVSTGSPVVTEVDVTNVVDQNGDALTETNSANIAVTGTGRVFQANGCAVLNGLVYFVETRVMDVLTGSPTSGSLGVYNPSTDYFYVDTEVFDQAADGLVAYGDYLIASAWGSFDPTALAGTLYYYDTTDETATFEVGLTGLVNPADIDINEDGMICVPSYNAAAGYIYFVQLSEHFDMTTTELVEETTEDAATTEDPEGDHAVHASMMIAAFVGVFALLF